MDASTKQSLDTANAAANVAVSLDKDKETVSVHVSPTYSETDYVLPSGRLAVVFMYVPIITNTIDC